MNNGVLSQEEIDALLRSATLQDDSSQQEATAGHDNLDYLLSDIEKDTLGELGNMAMGAAATALSTLLNTRVEITAPQVEVITYQMLENRYPMPFVLVEVDYTSGLHGTNLFVIQNQDALIIADLMMGNDGSNPPQELDEFYLSTVAEAMNQMMGSAATAMSQILAGRVEIGPPRTRTINLASEKLVTGQDEQAPVILITFSMQIGNLVNSHLLQLIPLDLGRKLVEQMLSDINKVEMPPVPETPAYIPEPELAPVIQQPIQDQVSRGGNGGVQSMAGETKKVTVQPVEFAPLDKGGAKAEMPQNLDLIMDVPLQITVELGKSRKTIKEILTLGPGSVVELDKLAGEPVDVLVNGKLVAKGEVVVIDENFGVRITDIVSPMERFGKLT